MKHTSPLLAVALFSTLLAACGERTDTGSALPDGLPLAQTADGEGVPLILLELLARERKLDLQIPEQRATVLTELTDYLLLAQLSRKENFSADVDFAAYVELNRLQAVANATAIQLRDGATVDDSVLRAEYDTEIKRLGSNQYDFSQLLFANEDDALAAASEAVDTPFDKVLETWSAKAAQARSFAAARPGQLPEPLAKALATLKAGDTLKVPVKTDFGWHIVHVSAVTPFVPPPFEQVKESIRATVLGQVVDQRIAKLRSDADVKVETPAAAAAASPEPAAASPKE
ncbi:MAG: peptidylprolyl isomerase [Dokdonella sp.]